MQEHRDKERMVIRVKILAILTLMIYNKLKRTLCLCNFNLAIGNMMSSIEINFSQSKSDIWSLR